MITFEPFWSMRLISLLLSDILCIVDSDADCWGAFDLKCTGQKFPAKNLCCSLELWVTGWEWFVIDQVVDGDGGFACRLATLHVLICVIKWI